MYLVKSVRLAGQILVHSYKFQPKLITVHFCVSQLIYYKGLDILYLLCLKVCKCVKRDV